MKSTRDRKSYKVFGTFLSRKGFSSSHALAGLFSEKFAHATKTSDWQTISAEDLKERKILPSDKHKTFSHWRNEMVRSSVLICMATKEELQDDKPNHKACLFKYGPKIAKYIELAILDNLPNRVEKIEEKIETKADNERVDKLEDDVKKLENEVKNLKQNVEGLTDIVLAALPPDTPIRRRIVLENIDNQVKCVELLEKESSNQLN